MGSFQFTWRNLNIYKMHKVFNVGMCVEGEFCVSAKFLNKFGAFELASVWLKYNIRMQKAMAPPMTMANTRERNFNGWSKQRRTGADNARNI